MKSWDLQKESEPPKDTLRNIRVPEMHIKALSSLEVYTMEQMDTFYAPTKTIPMG